VSVDNETKLLKPVGDDGVALRHYSDQ
jgi:hypothetical protein